MPNHSKDDAGSPQWKQLYDAARLEQDPAKVEERIDAAYRAIIDEWLARSAHEDGDLYKAVDHLRLLRKAWHATRLPKTGS